MLPQEKYELFFLHVRMSVCASVDLQYMII